MQDRFKVRVWDKQRKEYVYDVQATYDYGCENIGSYEHCNFQRVIEDDDFIVEQCTGLKDKNGKLIYEGDVVRVHRNHLGEHFVGKDYVVKFYQYQYWLHNCGYHPLSDFSYRANQNLEIIGNIYENKELLND